MLRRSGGLALWWTNEVDLDIRFKSKNIIRAIVTRLSHSFSFVSTFIYAPPKRSDRNMFWKDFVKMGRESSFPWLCVGDFNEIGASWEKRGGSLGRDNRVENFQATISECALMDLEFKGNAFTWTNNQREEANICERIDRAMANVEWRQHFPKAQVFHEVVLGSDHCPLILNCTLPLKRVPKLFKFESMWSTHPTCEDIISDSWDSRVQGSSMFRLAQKLRNCRQSLKEWSAKEFGNNKRKLEALKSQLAVIQVDCPSDSNMGDMYQIKKEIETLLDREEMYYHQRSRINWLRYGDRNTSFFHASVIQRRQRNQLLRLKDDNGDWATSEGDINQLLQGYFSNLFQGNGSRNMEDVLASIPQVITPSMNSSLTTTVSDAEIERAVFQLGALKAPGPDGYPGFFYQTYWGIVNETTRLAVKSFFNNGYILKELNHTNLILIPKTPAPEKLTQFRPISLCNLSLKIITKILANRLKLFLNQIISPQQ